MSAPDATPIVPVWGVDDFRFHHQPLLGTFVEVRVPWATDEAVAEAIDAAAVAEIERLQGVFSAFDAASELSRWRRGEVPNPSTEFAAAMRTAHEWQVRSEGRFNTASGAITEIWKRAEASGHPPTDADLAAAAAAITEPRFAIDDSGLPRPTGDCSGINLNAFVKGWIVDRAIEVARSLSPTTDVLVNAGGDLRHSGAAPIRVGIENPLRPYDNEPPVSIITLCNAGLATSGRSRRGFRIGDAWYSHVVDPRTGRTVDTSASISVVAADAATADVLATIMGVMQVDEALGYAEHSGVACFIIDTDGTKHATTGWDSVEVSRR